MNKGNAVFEEDSLAFYGSIDYVGLYWFLHGSFQS